VKYAIKLATPIKNDWYTTRKTRVLGRHVLENDYGVVRRYVPRHIADDILSALPRSITAHCSGITYSNIRPLKPHVHTEENCVINMYQTTNDATTIFYEGFSARLDGVTTDNGNKYYLVDDNLLTAVETFCAKPGDVWLLNTKQPHAVSESSKNFGAREVIQVFLTMPFDVAKTQLL